MRVAIVSPSLSRDGGAERMTCELANALAADGRDIAIVTRAPATFARQPIDPAVDVQQMYVPRGPKPLKDLQLPIVVSSLRAHIERVRPEIVIGNRWDCAILSLLAARRTSIPVVAWEMGYLGAARLSTAWRALRRITYPRAAAVVVLNEASVPHAKRFVDARAIHVIPFFAGAVRPPDVNAPSKWREFRGHAPEHRLLALGRLGPEKGFDLLVEAYARIAADLDDWAAIIVGRGPERSHLVDLIARHGLQERVQLVGPTADPTTTFSESDAFALPSRHEGFGLVLVEAMAAGLPVVAFACPGGPPEIVRHEVDGLLVEPGDVDGFADALRRVMSDAGLRTRLGGRARDVQDRFSRERVIRSWSALLEQVAARSAA